MFGRKMLVGLGTVQYSRVQSSTLCIVYCRLALLYLLLEGIVSFLLVFWILLSSVLYLFSTTKQLLLYVLWYDWYGWFPNMYDSMQSAILYSTVSPILPPPPPSSIYLRNSTGTDKFIIEQPQHHLYLLKYRTVLYSSLCLQQTNNAWLKLLFFGIRQPKILPRWNAKKIISLTVQILYCSSTVPTLEDGINHSIFFVFNTVW